MPPSTTEQLFELVRQLVKDNKAVATEAMTLANESRQEIEALSDRVRSLEASLAQANKAPTTPSEHWSGVVRALIDGTVRDPVSRRLLLGGVFVSALSVIAGCVWLLDRHPTLLGGVLPG